MISVIMASFNGERYIREQLDSIWNQSIKPDEIIIGDDGSEDGTIREIERFQVETGAPVHLLENEERIGYIRNFLNTLKYAKGDLLFLSDQDDVWKPDRIETAVRIMKEHSEIKVLNCAFELIDEKGVVIGTPKKNSGELKNISLQSFLRHPKYPGMAMAFRKEIAEKTLLREDVVSAHDWQINETAAEENGLYLIKCPLVEYRQHGNNTVGSLRTGKQKDGLKKRLILLKEMRTDLDTIDPEKLGKKDKLFIDKLKETLDGRIWLMERKRTLSVFWFGLLHLRYVSFISVLGDCAALVRG